MPEQQHSLWHFCFEETEVADLNSLLSGADANGSWTETSSVPSQGNAFDPNNASFSTDGQIPGIYTFEYTVISSGACPDDATEVSVIIHELPNATVADFVVLDCINTVLPLDASGSSTGQDFDISWLGPGVINDGNENTLNPNIDQPGIYELTITNNQTGCSAQASTEVTSNTDPPSAFAGNDDAITCNDPIISLQAGGDIGNGFEIEWSGPGINAGNMNNANPQVDLPGTYILSITDLSNSCVSEPDTVIILDQTVSPDIFTQFPTSEIDCNNQSISLTGGSNDQNVSFQWLDPDLQVISNSEIVSDVEVQGDYTLIVTNDATGCTASEIVTVTNNIDFPIANINNPPILDCINLESTLDGTGSTEGNNITYMWSGPAGGINGALDGISTNAILPGNYTLVVTNTDNGCSSSEQVNLEQNVDLPQVQIAEPEELDCSVTEVTLDGSGSSAGNEYSYSWMDDQGSELSTAISFETQIPGTYELIVSNSENGCTNSATVTVFENTDVPTDASFIFQDPSCHGDQDGSIFIEQVFGGTAPYLFSLNNASFTSTNIFSNLPSGSYEITLEDANGCQWNTTILIQEPAPIDLNLGPDIELELGENANVEAQVNLSLNQIDTLIWSPEGLVLCADALCLEGILQTFNTVSLSATVFDENGCRATDDITIVMQKDRRIFIPTAFSPNGDGTNDTFTIYVDESQIEKIHQFSIFNRWGETVFEAENFEPNDPTKGWNGEFKNERLNPGVFVYFAEIEFIDGFKEVYKGDVTLMK